MTFYFATHNKHKLSEVQNIIGNKVTIKSISELQCFEEIPETGNSLEENALQKARYIYNKYHCNCFADDTGLEIDALGGRPGVYSARYAGENCSFEDNMRKVLIEMRGITDRSARFRAVIALIIDGKEYLFEGKVEGEIIEDEKGDAGFGYDPIFRPKGFSETFAEMPADKKNEISHRGLAVEKLIAFLCQL